MSLQLFRNPNRLEATASVEHERRACCLLRLRPVTRGSQRRGSAVVETAIVLPVIVVLAFAAIELSNGIFLKEAVTIAAYEGARSATRPGGTNANSESRIAEVLSSRSVGAYTVSFSTNVTESTLRGTQITVTVVAEADEHALNPLRLLQNRTMSSSVTMVRL